MRAMMKMFEVTEETAALKVVEEVGHGNSFLNHVHTARNFRKELIIRDPEKKKWQATMSDKMVPEVRELVLRTLKEHQVPSIDADTLRKGDQLIADYEKELGV
jgi:trimethylamine--corrinoid protein Co-methyltransferase